MGLLKTTTPITIFKKSEEQVDQWGVPVYEAETSFVVKARMKGSFTLSQDTSLNNVNGSNVEAKAELSFNGFVNIQADDRVEFLNEYGSQMVSKIGSVSFVKDFNGKILLTKAVVL